MKTNDGLVLWPDAVLRKPCRPVKPAEFGSDTLTELVYGLEERRGRSQGVGLAAPQIGVPLRVAVVRLKAPADAAPGSGDAVDRYYELINPYIEPIYGTEAYDPDFWVDSPPAYPREGCLSVPSVERQVPRHRMIKVTYQSVNGEEDTIHCGGLLAQVIQHEVDHLDGVCIPDSLPFVQRDTVRRRVQKVARLLARLAKAKAANERKRRNEPGQVASSRRGELHSAGASLETQAPRQPEIVASSGEETAAVAG